jgi:hypothetical protein
MVENYNRSALSSLLTMHADGPQPAFSPVPIGHIAHVAHDGQGLCQGRPPAADLPSYAFVRIP